MKVKIEFEVNTSTVNLLKCLYDRLDILRHDLTLMDSDFKDINVTVTTHSNQIYEGTPHINFHKPSTKNYRVEFPNPVEQVDLYGDFCTMFYQGTCWGTKEREKCSCGGLKRFCTHYPEKPILKGRTMEVKFVCQNCGDTERKVAFVNHSTQEEYFVCPSCLSTFEKIGDEYVSINNSSNCKYNTFVECEPNKRLPRECRKCGWNPKVCKERKEKISERG